MERYRRVLSNKPFARLWIGSTVSGFGDTLTWVALLWIVHDRTHSPHMVGLLAVVATTPTIVGGVLMGSALDRFERKRFLALINTVLGIAVLSVPVASSLGHVNLVHLFAVAAVFGFFKMANWAGVPSMLPSLLSESDDLNTANAMESISYGIADVAGPSVAAALIGAFGAVWVLGVDAVTFCVFVLALLSLPKEIRASRAEAAKGLQLRPALLFIWRDKAILAITVMFMSANISGGMTMVFILFYATEVLHGGPRTFGLMASSLAVSEVIGAVLLGGMRWPFPLGRSIAAAQGLTGVSLLFFLMLPRLGTALVVLVISGVFSSPLTIWAQTIRMQRIPAEMRGRVFGLLRTIMQSTTPLGGAVAGFLIPHGMRKTALVMAIVIGVPGIVGLFIRSLSPMNADGR